MIYADYNATTPLDPAARDAMERYLSEEFGNPSSAHPLGRRAREAVEEARIDVSRLIGCDPDEVVFTSGGSESNNAVIKGMAHLHRGERIHIVTSVVEHPSVLEACRFLEGMGVSVTYVSVDGYGAVDPEEIRRSIRPETVLISIMHANNEVGTIQPIEEIARLAGETSVPFHTDASQSVGKVRVNVRELGVDYLTLAGHKLYAPKGIGALFIRRGSPFVPLIHGGPQEGSRRAGTENVPYIVALGRACRLARELLEIENMRLSTLRDMLYKGLKEAVAGLTLNGHPHKRLPNTLNVSFPGLTSQSLLEGLDEICVSTGSACHEGSTSPSKVLTAMGIPPERALGAVRFSLGRWTTEDEVRRIVRMVSSRYNQLMGRKESA